MSDNIGIERNSRDSTDESNIYHMKDLIDPRSDEERRVDTEYNAMIEDVLGPDALDRPLRDYIGGLAIGGASIAVDTADTGYHYAAPLSDDEFNRQELFALEALNVAYRHTPIGNSRDQS